MGRRSIASSDYPGALNSQNLMMKEEKIHDPVTWKQFQRIIGVTKGASKVSPGSQAARKLQSMNFYPDYRGMPLGARVDLHKSMY